MKKMNIQKTNALFLIVALAGFDSVASEEGPAPTINDRDEKFVVGIGFSQFGIADYSETIFLWNQSSNFQLGLTIFRFSGERTIWEDTDHFSIESDSAIRAIARYWLFDNGSFNLTAGVGNAKVKGYNGPKGPDEKFPYSGKLVFTQVAVGNQWSNDGFYIGCDWIGLNSVTPKFSYSGSDYESDLGPEYHIKKQHVLSFFLLNFYIGVGF